MLIKKIFLYEISYFETFYIIFSLSIILNIFFSMKSNQAIQGGKKLNSEENRLTKI
jgi:hypothetical protein